MTGGTAKTPAAICELCDRPIADASEVCRAKLLACGRQFGPVVMVLTAAHQDCAERWVRIVDEEFSNQGTKENEE